MTFSDYKYDAFISYRHISHDQAIAEKIQILLEKLSLRGNARKSESALTNRIFRDQSELPTSGDLGSDIENALQKSRFLICVCSPEYTKSEWCLKEISYFKKIHDNKNSNILTILVRGEPHEAFPEILTYEERIEGNAVVRRKVEPLAADVRCKNTKESLKKLRTEILRLEAPILGLSFDDLFQRKQRGKIKLFLTVSTAVILFFSIFGSVSFLQAVKISAQSEQLANQKNQLLFNQSRFLTSLAQTRCQSGDSVIGLLLSLKALPSDLNNPEKPVLPETISTLRNLLFKLDYGKDPLIPFQDSGTSDLIFGASNSEAYAVCFNDDGSKSIIKDLTGIYVYDTRNGRQICKLSADKFFNKIQFLKNNCILFAAENKISIIDSETGNVIKSIYSSPLKAIAISPNEELAAVVDNSLELYLLNLETGEKKAQIDLSAYCKETNNRFLNVELQFSAESATVLASVTGESTSVIGQSETLLLINTAGGKVQFSDNVRTLPCGKSLINKDNMFYLSDGGSHAQGIYNTAGEKILSLSGNIQNIALSDNIAAVSYKDDTVLYSLKTGEKYMSIPVNTDGFTGDTIQFSPDSRLLAISGSDAMIMDIITKQVIYDAKTKFDVGIATCAFSPDSQLFYFMFSGKSLSRNSIIVGAPNLMIIDLSGAKPTPFYKANIPSMNDYAICPPVQYANKAGEFALTLTDGVHLYNLDKKKHLAPNPCESVLNSASIKQINISQKRIFINDGNLTVYDYGNNKILYQSTGLNGCTNQQISKVAELSGKSAAIFDLNHQLLATVNANNNVSSAAFGDTDMFACGDIAGNILFHSFASTAPSNIQLGESPIVALVFSHSCDFLVCLQKSAVISFIDLKKGIVKRSVPVLGGVLPQKNISVTLNEAAQMVAVTAGEEEEICDLKTLIPVVPNNAFPNSSELAANPFTVKGDYMEIQKRDQNTRILHIKDPRTQKDVFTCSFSDLSISRDGKRLAVMPDSDSDICIYDLAGDHISKISTIKNTIQNGHGIMQFSKDSMRLSDDGNYLVLYNNEWKPSLYQCEDGSLVLQFDTKINILISPDDKELITSSSLYYNNFAGCILPLLTEKELVNEAQDWLIGNDRVLRSLTAEEKKLYFITDIYDH